MKYLVDVSHSTVTSVTVDAESQQEAIESALRNEGDSADSQPGDTFVIAVRCLD